MAEQRGCVRPRVCTDLPVKPKTQVRFLPFRSAQQEGRRQSHDGRAPRIDLQSAVPPETQIHKTALLRSLGSVVGQWSHKPSVEGSIPSGSICNSRQKKGEGGYEQRRSCSITRCRIRTRLEVHRVLRPGQHEETRYQVDSYYWIYRSRKRKEGRHWLH